MIACLLGTPERELAGQGPSLPARTIDEAVRLAVECLDGPGGHAALKLSEPERRLAAETRRHWSTKQRYLRGLFAGGTFCYQTQQILQDRGLDTCSNAPLKPGRELPDPGKSVGHTLLDMGDEAHTLARPHPMIDATMRKQRILAEAHDPEVAALLLDFILGYNASDDPVGDLLDSILQAKQIILASGGRLAVVASVCGTDQDPQDLALQRRLLEEAGVIVFESSARAALFCSQLLSPE